MLEGVHDSSVKGMIEQSLLCNTNVVGDVLSDLPP